MITSEQFDELVAKSSVTKCIKDTYDQYLDDAYKFYIKNNNAAGTRARKSLMLMKQMISDARQDIQAIKNDK